MDASDTEDTCDRIAILCGLFAILLATSIVVGSCMAGPEYAPAATPIGQHP